MFDQTTRNPISSQAFWLSAYHLGGNQGDEDRSQHVTRFLCKRPGGHAMAGPRSSGSPRAPGLLQRGYLVVRTQCSALLCHAPPCRALSLSPSCGADRGCPTLPAATATPPSPAQLHCRRRRAEGGARKREEETMMTWIMYFFQGACWVSVQVCMRHGARTASATRHPWPPLTVVRQISVISMLREAHAAAGKTRRGTRGHACAPGSGRPLGLNGSPPDQTIATI